VTNVYIRTIGIHSERCADTASLTAALAEERTAAPPADRYASPAIRLGAAGLKVIGREDRSTLNDMSTGVLNAISDAIHNSDEAWLSNNENVPVFTGNDGAELTFNALGSLMARHGDDDDATLNRLGELKGLSNPINMLRLLSTNVTYHTSKRLGAQGGGYPNQGMSLSGLCALEDAVNTLQEGGEGGQQRAIVVASGNMRSFDSMVVFGKLGLLEQGAIDPSYGAAALVIDREDAAPGRAPLAEVLGVHTMFAPEPFVNEATWETLFRHAYRGFGAPDVVVSYANGAPTIERNESAARRTVFGAVPTRNYKAYFGYTGKANNLLDLAAVLSDDAIPTGATVLLCGAGFGFGIGYLVLRKLGKPPMH
jgi:3-oxoacyl-(acyl-carrier-protein) synthase